MICVEGVAARWLSGLHPRPDTIDGLMGALQAAFRHHNYALELESQLRSRKMGPDEPVMSYCYDIIYLCSKVDPAMVEERKVQFIFQNMEPTLVQKVFPQMDGMNTAELFRLLQAHSQAAVIAGRSVPVNQIFPTPPASSKAEIEKFVREEVTKSIEPIVRELKEATRSLGASRGSRDRWRERTGERDQNPPSRQQDRPNKRKDECRTKLDRVHVSSLKPFRRRAPSKNACVKSPATAPPPAVNKKEARQRTPKVVRRRSQAA